MGCKNLSMVGFMKLKPWQCHWYRHDKLDTSVAAENIRHSRRSDHTAETPCWPRRPCTPCTFSLPSTSRSPSTFLSSALNLDTRSPNAMLNCHSPTSVYTRQLQIYPLVNCHHCFYCNHHLTSIIMAVLASSLSAYFILLLLLLLLLLHPFNGLFSRTTWEAGTRKVNHSVFYWSKRWWDDSGWTICKSFTPCSRETGCSNQQVSTYWSTAFLVHLAVKRSLLLAHTHRLHKVPKENHWWKSERVLTGQMFFLLHNLKH